MVILIGAIMTFMVIQMWKHRTRYKFFRKLMRLFGGYRTFTRAVPGGTPAWMTLKGSDKSVQIVVDKFIWDGWVEEK